MAVELWDTITGLHNLTGNDRLLFGLQCMTINATLPTANTFSHPFHL